MTSDRIRSPRANTQPIYPRVPLFWAAKLTTQIAGYAPATEPATAGPSQAPVLLGKAGENGAILEMLTWTSVYEPPAGGGGGGSAGGGGTGSAVDGATGFGIVGNPAAFHIYSRKFGASDLIYLQTIVADPNGRVQVSPWGYPLLPNPQIGLRLEPDEEIFCALKRKVPGIWVMFRGGHY